MPDLNLTLRIELDQEDKDLLIRTAIEYQAEVDAGRMTKQEAFDNLRALSYSVMRVQVDG